MLKTDHIEEMRVNDYVVVYGMFLEGAKFNFELMSLEDTNTSILY